MSTRTNEPKRTKNETARNKQYYREFVPAIALYMALIGVAAVLGEKSMIGRLIMAVVVPVVPGILIVRAVYRAYLRSDEYERHELLLSLSWGFAAAMVTALILGCLSVAKFSTSVHLDGVSVPHSLDGWIVFVVGMSTWGIVRILRTAKHRSPNA